MKQLIPLVIGIFLIHNSHAQENQTDSSKYATIINQISVLRHHNIENSPLVKVYIATKSKGQWTYTGWITKVSNKEINLVRINGQEIQIPISTIIEKKEISFKNISSERLDSLSTGPLLDLGYIHASSYSIRHYLLALWLHHHKLNKLSNEVLSKLDSTYFKKETITNSFGDLYYNEILVAYSLERNYQKALTYGRILERTDFKDYKYYGTVRSLNAQLENRRSDFKTFYLPDSLNWSKIKITLSRQEQLSYLLDRLHLMNCIQDGQPGGISYFMPQQSISRIALQNRIKDYKDYWKVFSKFKVINPYDEILLMHPSISEIPILLPYLLDSSYIPTYTYWRDFHSDRTLYKFNWLIESLIFNITNKRFYKKNELNQLSFNENEKRISLIEKWCRENEKLSPEENIINILSTTNNWTEFNRAMSISLNEKYISAISVLEKRYKDFQTSGWPSQKGLIAKAMFEMGTKENINTVKQWYDKPDDFWVELWASLFLLKNNATNSQTVLNSLSTLLNKKCDGTTLYPYAVPTLLKLNDPKALSVAEGILKKYHFIDMFYWDYYQDFIKMLLLAKSEKAYVFMYNGLKNTSVNGNVISTNKSGKKLIVLNCDNFIEVLEKWKENKD